MQPSATQVTVLLDGSVQQFIQWLCSQTGIRLIYVVEGYQIVALVEGDTEPLVEQIQQWDDVREIITSPITNLRILDEEVL